MTVIKRHALVAYSARQMFELVDNVIEYPRFLQWCSAADELRRDENSVEASLDIVWHGIHKSFITRNYLHPYNHIEIELVKGPFKHLEGRWSFMELNPKACKVCLDLEFEFAGHMLDLAFSPVFNHIANSLVDAFCKRAVEVYGTP